MSEHPSLSAPRHKEIHFFDRERRDWSKPNYKKLGVVFPADDGDRIRFESTPSYGFSTEALGRIHQYNPDAKLIFLFRDPFERAYSHWSMEVSRGREKLAFGDAIRDGRKRYEDLPQGAREWRFFTYVERGFYAEQVRRALAHFPPDQLLFLRSEDLLKDHTATLARVADFVGIPPFPPTEPKVEHSRRKKVAHLKPTEEDRAHIAGLVRDDLHEFSALTGLDISAWASMKPCS